MNEQERLDGLERDLQEYQYNVSDENILDRICKATWPKDTTPEYALIVSDILPSKTFEDLSSEERLFCRAVLRRRFLEKIKHTEEQIAATKDPEKFFLSRTPLTDHGDTYVVHAVSENGRVFEVFVDLSIIHPKQLIHVAYSDHANDIHIVDTVMTLAFKQILNSKTFRYKYNDLNIDMTSETWRFNTIGLEFVSCLRFDGGTPKELINKNNYIRQY